MTTLDLTAIAIAPASDLSDVLLLGAASESATLATPATVRRYAGGRDRVVTSAGQTDTLTFTFAGVARASYLSLLDLAGALVLVRDERQRRVWGVISDVSGTEFGSRNGYLSNVNFSIQSATYSEVV